MQADYCPEEEEQEKSIIFKRKTPIVRLCPLSIMTITIVIRVDVVPHKKHSGSDGWVTYMK